MATTNGNRKLLNLKKWEFCSPAPVASVAGAFVASSRHYQQRQLYVASTTAAYMYAPEDDGWIQVPSPALATFAAGACGVAAAWSTGAAAGTGSLTATAGTTTTITTNQTIVRDLRGYSVHILAGPNAGETKVIEKNTIGANSVITFTAASGVAFSASTVYRLLTPNWFVLGAGTLASGSFKRYDLATNTWVTLANTGLPATLGTDCRLVSTPSWNLNDYKSFATGTATAGGATTLTNAAKAWATNQWANSQVRIVSGTGAGQIRTIASNTATVLTVSASWGTNPDATSVYSIEGNDDFIYLMGNAAVTLYRYSITANTWTTLSPGVARAGNPGAGLGGQWISGADAADWTNENAIQNGRYIYSMRGGGSAALDRYDIAGNTWNAQSFGPSTETFTTGSKYGANGRYIYIQKDATNRWMEFDVVTNEMMGWSTMLYPQGAAVVGDTSFDATYVDGATEITWVYMLLNTSTVLLRAMVIPDA